MQNPQGSGRMIVKVTGSCLQTDSAVVANILQDGCKFRIGRPFVFVKGENTLTLSGQEGTGKVYIQSLNLDSLAQNLIPLLPFKND